MKILILRFVKDHAIVLKVSLILLLFKCTGFNLFAQQFREISVQSKLSTASNNNGVAVADYDNDNDLDVFVVTRWNGKAPATSQLFRNENNGTFTNVTAASGIQSTHDYSDDPPETPHPVGEKMGASWGDFNNDGYADLFLTSAYYLELYENNQDGTFTNITAEAGLPLKNDCINDVGLWFDFNNDSYLDLYVSGVFGCLGKLYKNNGNSTFTEVSESMGLAASGRAAWTAIPLDINDDGFQDIYIANDFGVPNELYINNAGTSFEDKSEDYGITDILRDGMGIARADYNNDGLADLYITNINESSLYKNLGNGSFQNVASDLNVRLTGWAWGCQFEDFDHDLDLDLMVANGYYDGDYDRYYENALETGVSTFLDHSIDVGMGEPSISNGLATFDYDNDGDMDILVGRTGDHLGFYENETIISEENPDQNWVQIDLIGTTSNRDAIGALVKIKLGDVTLTRFKHGAGLMAQNQTPVHFGLADNSSIALVTIKWPSGLVETYDNFPINSYIRATEGAGFEVLELTSNKIRGCTDPNSCNYNPDATFNDGSCSYMSSKAINGNGTAGVLSVETYTYAETPGNSYVWSVVNGKIVDGQGTPSISVKWQFSGHGEVTVTEIGECYSEPATLDVTLKSDSAPENVSVARLWNEALLAAIRVDYARPTVHARNLFHTSIAMYDAWAILNKKADTYLIGKQLHNYYNDFEGFDTPINKKEAVNMAISYAAYRLLSYRFKDSPNSEITLKKFDDLMNLLGYDPYHTFSDYRGGDPAALGNFIAQSVIEYGLIDGANESNKYGYSYYEPINEPLAPILPGNPTIEYPNHWQPLQFEIFIDQSGNVSGTTPPFLGPEWGNVKPFCLRQEDASIYSRDGHEYVVYHDPGSPPLINSLNMEGPTHMDVYKWNFSLVSMWSSHLNPYDGVTWDISPAALGNININDIPTKLENYDNFYDMVNGGDIGKGRKTNPVTGEPYAHQIVPRGDYTRVLAEFWADGPDSETPPGHWFVLLNYVSDHPDFKRQFNGKGSVLDPLEWDVKAYFTLGGAMHDAAIAAWGIKGWYDYVRPISAIRYMADQGQSSDPALDNYDPDGMPLIDGYIEVVKVGDPLAGEENQNVGKIKVMAWRGHEYIEDPKVDEAGVGWILAENWWPYQRPSFVTPPFAGYVSGHSTYSRAAAEILTRLTGSPYFPGGLGEFVAKKNEFLVFEEGPSQDVTLQWATYRDASDQCSLSRIWGGIHPPADDLAGRMIGARIGADAFEKAEEYFKGDGSKFEVKNHIYPVPTTSREVYITNTTSNQEFTAYDLQGNRIAIEKKSYNQITGVTDIAFSHFNRGLYLLKSGSRAWKIILQ